jgi:hypothetical protein
MAATEQCVPILSKLPYVGRLFKNVVVAPVDEVCAPEELECPAAQTIRFVGPDGLERIGIDFDCEVTENCAQCQAKRCAVANATRATAVCPAPPASCPSVAVCPPPGSGIAVQACEVLPAPFAFVQQLGVAADRDDLVEALMEARVEAAVAQATLKARDESDAKQLELIKELVTSQVENAKLTAKLELAAEKEKLLVQLIETRAEVAALQADQRRKEVAQRKRQTKSVEARRPATSVR